MDVDINDTHDEGIKCNGKEGFTSDTLTKKTHVPRRVLHFSDGTIEEYSTDEETEDVVTKSTVQELNAVDPKSLTWGPWFKYKSVLFGSKTLAVCDYAGEKLADFFGITSPKYEYEIDVYESMKAEEQQKSQEDVELGGWSAKSDTDTSQATTATTVVTNSNRNL